MKARIINLASAVTAALILEIICGVLFWRVDWRLGLAWLLSNLANLCSKDAVGKALLDPEVLKVFHQIGREEAALKVCFYCPACGKYYSHRAAHKGCDELGENMRETRDYNGQF